MSISLFVASEEVKYDSAVALTTQAKIKPYLLRSYFAGPRTGNVSLVIVREEKGMLIFLYNTSLMRASR